MTSQVAMREPCQAYKFRVDRSRRVPRREAAIRWKDWSLKGLRAMPYEGSLLRDSRGCCSCKLRTPLTRQAEPMPRRAPEKLPGDKFHVFLQLRGFTAPIKIFGRGLTRPSTGEILT